MVSRRTGSMKVQKKEKRRKKIHKIQKSRMQLQIIITTLDIIEIEKTTANPNYDIGVA